MKCEFELAHVQNEWLASMRLLELAEAHVKTSEQAVAELQLERDALKEEVKKLHDKIWKLQKGSPTIEETDGTITQESLKCLRTIAHQLH